MLAFNQRQISVKSAPKQANKNQNDIIEATKGEQTKQFALDLSKVAKTVERVKEKAKENMPEPELSTTPRDWTASKPENKARPLNQNLVQSYIRERDQ